MKFYAKPEEGNNINGRSVVDGYLYQTDDIKLAIGESVPIFFWMSLTKEEQQLYVSLVLQYGKTGCRVTSQKWGMSLEDWIASDECVQFLEIINKDLHDMTVSFEAEGDVISMICTMTEQIDIAEDAADTMSAYFSVNSDIFEAIRDQLIAETGNQNIVLELIYRNANGSDIFSQEF